METIQIKDCLMPAMVAAAAAGTAILEVYGQEFTVEEKEDKSPLTLADKRAHEIIMHRLSPMNLPVLSEEGRSIAYHVRKQWEYFWMVDPLDGTKEFVKRNDEFTVNIALIQFNRPVMGVIYVPVLRQLYFAAMDFGAYRTTLDAGMDLMQMSLEQMVDNSLLITAKAEKTRPFTIVGSRSHATKELEAYVEQKRKIHENLEFISAGSSLKLCRVAEGSADVYPRLGPTMEWDTAAGHIIAECAGASVFRADTGEPMRYNKENLLNPWFFISNGKH